MKIASRWLSSAAIDSDITRVGQPAPTGEFANIDT